MKLPPPLSATLAVLICECAGLIGAIYTIPSVNSWYPHLVKPPLNPPAWVFGPVWTTLYALMGVAAFLVWRTPKGTPRRNALILFAIQLFLNTTWSILFFGYHSALTAFIDIILLLITLVTTTILFSKLSRVSALLLFPYILWVTFASYLNLMILLLNR